MDTLPLPASTSKPGAQATSSVTIPVQTASTKAIHRTHPRGKIGRILTTLAAGRSLNRFEAERVGDHTLHSTVSSIERRYGIRVDRLEETVPGYAGHKTRVMRYWLSPEQQELAAKLMGIAHA